MDEFRGLDKDIEGAAKRWKKFIESECPEKEKFPGEWKNKSSLQVSTLNAPIKNYSDF